MSGLHDELAGESTTSCKVCAFLTSLPPSLAEEWRRELALPVNIVGNTAIVRALSRRHVDVTEPSVRRHRSRHGFAG